MRLKVISLGVVIVALAAYTFVSMGQDVELRRVVISRCTLSRSVHIVGPLMPSESAVVLPKMPSRIKALAVQQGQRVTKGQPLVYLDADDLRLDYERAALAYQRAQRKRDSIDSNGEQRSVAELEVRETELAVRVARGRLSDSILRAPIDGDVVQLGVRVGDYMTSSRVSGGDGIVLAGTSELVVRAEADEFAAVQVSQGQRARVRMQAVRGIAVPGVVALDPIIRRANIDGKRSAVFEVLVLLEGPAPAGARVGTTAEAEIDVFKRDDALCVPINAVVEAEGGTHVLLWDHGRYIARPVALGVDDGDRAEILEGVSEGMFVATGTSAELLATGWKRN